MSSRRLLGGIVVVASLTAAPMAPVALAGGSTATEAQFKKKAHKIAKGLGNKFGRKFDKPLIVRFSQDQPENPSTGGRAPARTFPARRSNGDWVRVDDGPMKGCVVEVFPTGQQLVGSEVRGMLAHEITHCLQLELLGVDGQESLKPWLKEGSAQWVGYVYAGGAWDAREVWDRYATGPSRALFRRSYDAVGFFAHIARRANAYKAIVAMTRASRLQGNEGAFRTAQKSWGKSPAKQHEFLRVWATSYTRDPGLGRSWEMTGPGLPDDAIAEPWLAKLDGPTEQALLYKSKQVSVGVYDLFVTDGLVIRAAGRGYGALRWLGTKRETRFNGQFDHSYCVRSCACPAGAHLDPAIETVASPAAAIAATPGLGVPGASDSSGILQLEARSPADYCKPNRAGAVRVDPCALYSLGEARTLLRAIVPPEIPVENVTGGVPSFPRPSEPVDDETYEACLFISSFGDSIWVDQLREDAPSLLRLLPTLEPVQGVGDAAFLQQRRPDNLRLYFYVGPMLLSVHFLVLPEAPRGPLIALAQTVAGRARGVCC